MLIDLRDAADVASAGGKARGLARLIAVGLPVPPGVVLLGEAFEAVAGPLAAGAALADVGAVVAARAEAAAHAPIDPALEAAVIARARALGPRLAVRSSMALEDGDAAAAPGLGATVLDVAPDAVWPAIRAVWAAALTPLVVAYARAMGGAAIAAPAVIVQRQADGAPATIYTRPPGRPGADEVWIAIAGATERAPRDRGRDELALAVDAEAAIGATTGADVELVRGDGGAWAIVQARPLIHPLPRPPRQPPPPFLLAPLRAPHRAWRRDVTHNPAPLSVAQAELCARVEAAAIAPFHLAVVASHLYWAPRDGAPAPAVTSAADLAGRLATAEAALAAVLDGAAPATLEDAIARYLAAYRILAGELGPLVAAGRAVLPAALAARGLPAALAAALTAHRPSSIAARLAAAARGTIDRAALVAAIGDAAPAWDVAAPTFAESPRLLDDALARAAARPPPPPEPPVPDGLAEEVAIARLAADASERDDLGYWRAQALVRRALLAVAAARGLDAGDVCWLPFAELPAIEPAVARGRAAAARAAAARAASWDLPLALDEPAADPAASAWQGEGLGPVVAGPVHHADGASPIPRGAIAVARAVTPALAIHLDGAAAIVSEHGTLLDHGAAMARELGIPCVVGCRGIHDALAEGTWVTVDGDRGTVQLVAHSLAHAGPSSRTT